jgi:probable DNA repair protein
VTGRLFDITPLEPLVEAGFVLLTPNFRLARRIKAEWDTRRLANGELVWLPLKVQPLESWLLAQWERAVSLHLVPALTPLNPAQVKELWQQVIAQEERQSDDYHLLRPSAAAELAGQARDSLLRWEVDMTAEGIRQSFNFDADCGTFVRWLTLFEQRLSAAGQCTPVDCIRHTLAAASQLPTCRAALVEFDDIPPLFRSALNALCDEVPEIAPAGTSGRRLAHAFSDKRAELQAVASWSSRINRRDPTATVGVVLSDMAADRTALDYLLRREFDCLGEDYNSLPVNFSTGISLDRAPVIRDALSALAMGQQRTTVPAVVATLRSRFLHLPDADSALANRFVTRLFDDGREVVETADLRYTASEVKLGDDKGLVLGQHLLAVSGLRDLRQTALPSHWVERFCEVLVIWGWPGSGPLDSLEYQQVELWYRTLDEFKGYDAVCQPLEFDAALQLLRHSCSRQMSQPQTADSAVQVLGPLEAAGLAFDHLWVCGMQGNSWPTPARPNPFIPQSLQRQLQMPHATAEREWAFSEALFGQYTRSSGVLHASYCKQVGGIPELPSALLQDFDEDDVAEDVAELPEVTPLWTRQWQQRAVEQLTDDRAPPLSAEQLEANTSPGGSGLLEDQSQCPFRAFARRRLLVEPLSTFSVALSASERGSLLHDALFALWGDIQDHPTLLALDDAAEEQAVVRAVQAAIEKIPGGRRRLLGRAYWRLEGRRLAGLLREWLAVERQRSTFVVLQREEEITLQLAQLQIRLRVDRIDQLPDGSQVIIDYKSGTSKVQDWLGERPARPQLLLYGIAAPGSAAALTFAQVRPRECRFIGLGEVAAAPGIATDIPKVVKERMEADDWQSLNECWRENLERLAQAFVAGDAKVDPLAPASCTWCGLQPLCRINIAGDRLAAEPVEQSAGGEV